MLDGVDEAIRTFCTFFPTDTFLYFTFNVKGLIAILLVSLVCGGVGSLVVGNRMAFFSDALAHCAFAGVGLGLLLGLVTAASADLLRPLLLAVMVPLGLCFGLGIAFVRERTGQSNDTVIGVFFAGAIAMGGIFLKIAAARRYLPPEDFLFGNLMTVTALDLILLAILVVLTAATLALIYNGLVFSSFSRSLAMSRRVPIVLLQFVFIGLLAMVVNLSLMIVGALLINGLLIVPAAAAANVSRNLRQLFWTSVGICVTAGVLGQWLSWEIKLPGARGIDARPGEGPTIVGLAVLVFFGTMMWKGLRERRRA